MVKNILKIIFVFIVGISGGIFADQILWPYFIERPLFYQYRLDQPPILVTERKEVYIQENVALKDAIEKVDNSVVAVKTKTKAGKTLEGSGLILTSDGIMITLAELVPQDSVFSFFIEGNLVPFQVLKRDLKENLALVKIEKSGLATVSFFNYDQLKPGERVFLVGAVFDLGKIKNSVNEGIVKNFSESSIETNIYESSLMAGSPLFDIGGNLLGINTIKKDGQVSAIPVSKIRQFTGF